MNFVFVGNLYQVYASIWNFLFQFFSYVYWKLPLQVGHSSKHIMHIIDKIIYRWQVFQLMYEMETEASFCFILYMKLNTSHYSTVLIIIFNILWRRGEGCWLLVSRMSKFWCQTESGFINWKKCLKRNVSTPAVALQTALKFIVEINLYKSTSCDKCGCFPTRKYLWICQQ